MTHGAQWAVSAADEARFWLRVNQTDAPSCWVWTGSVTRKGYAVVMAGGNTRPAHRVSYIIANGPVDPDLEIDHLCRNRACVNPAHLEAVTCRENLLRSPITITTHCATTVECPQGHPYAGQNLYVDPEGFRHCRTCRRANDARYHRRAKAAV